MLVTSLTQRLGYGFTSNKEIKDKVNNCLVRWRVSLLFSTGFSGLSVGQSSNCVCKSVCNVLLDRLAQKIHSEVNAP